VSSEGAAQAYVPFVDGLRAVSILAVVGYHAGVPGFDGGFVGVDVFLVISGYLIIGQIQAGLRSGRHSMAEFWGRRVLRILPPYLLVILVSLVLAHYCLVSAGEWRDFLNQVVWSAGMSGNHYFLQQQGYFETDADSKVLLHLWSLAVEEQFYLVTPLILVAIWTFGRRAKSRVVAAVWQLGLPCVLFVSSLVLCIALTAEDETPNYAFFLMPLRAWEFILGGAIPVALGVLRRSGRFVNDALQMLALLAIVVAVGSFSEKAPFPSYRAMLPALAATVLIVCGSAQPAGLVARLLATRPLVGIGLVSYSWYLWHWPLLAFQRALNYGERKLPDDLVAALVSLALAVGTYYLIERPIRRWRQAHGALTWRFSQLGLLACAAVAGVGLGLLRLPSGGDVALAMVVDEDQTTDDPCDFRRKHSFAACTKARSGRELGLVMGDSHASGIYRYLDARLDPSAFALARSTSRSCSPIQGVVPLRSRDPRWEERCVKRKNALSKSLKKGELAPDFAILTAWWKVYADGQDRQVVLPDRSKKVSQKRAFVAQLRNTLKTLNKAGAKRILIVGPAPELPHEAPGCVARALAWGDPVDERCGTPRSKLGPSRRALRWLEEAAQGLPYVRIVDPTSTLCDERQCRAYDTEVLYLDRHHLADAGIDRVRATNEDAFSWVVGQQVPPPRVR